MNNYILHLSFFTLNDEYILNRVSKKSLHHFKFE